ncbi:hypothetical protein ID853_17040 [Xenorhabdus sp. Vera]|uniref:hypothetical protein n=1 Tax=Xenorhabdus TaxID=626 RepID=UPI0019B867EE|nr:MULTISPECIES: hypothetical protein [unclassified Xenorhabdus]MBD2812538.1 hypothetical protein [Xenorhabdus sp. Vera]
MAYSLGRIGSFIEYEKSQGRQWRKKGIGQLYYSNFVTGGSRYNYPILWIVLDSRGNLKSVSYETGHHMGYTLYLNDIWFEYNVNHHARDVRAAVGSIRQFWP